MWNVKFPELCWNFNGQLQQLGTKSEVSLIDRAGQKAWLPIAICWENIPTPVYLCMCAAFTNEISWDIIHTDAYTMLHFYISYCIYNKYICIHYIHIMRLLIVTVVCEYIPRLESPYRFTSSEMRSLCSCNGSKGSCGIAQREGFRPASRDGKGCCQWSLTHGRWPEQVVDHALGFIDRSPPTPGCGEKQNGSGGDDLTVFELREEHHVAGITVFWRFDLDLDSV